MLNALMGLGNRVINTSSTSISGLPAARRLQEEVNNHEKLGDLDKAKECFEAGILKTEGLLWRTHNKSELRKIREQLAASHFYYGNFLRECGDKLNAEANYKKALEHAGYMDLEQPEVMGLFNQISAQYRSILSEDGNASQENINQLDRTKVSDEHGRISKLGLMPLRRQVDTPIQEKSARVDYLFEKALLTLSSLDVSDKPSIFLVYAHDNKAHGKADASTSKYLIEKLSQIQVVLYSDQTPMGQPYSSTLRDLKQDGKLEDILTNQLCLLPDRLRGDVEPVNKVVMCCSEVLGSYLKWPDYDIFCQKLREAYREDREAYLKDGEQANAWAIREVVRQFSQEKKYKTGFHHVLTEMAFLQIRAERRKDGHGIIPVPLTRNSYDDCLSCFISATTVRMEEIPHFEAQAQAGREVYPNQSRHWVLFKLIERILVGSDEAQTILNKFWNGYSDCISRLKNESTFGESEFRKLMDGIFGEIERALHKQLAANVKQFYPAWKQMDARLLDQSRNLTQIQTGVDLLVAKLLGNLQENIQKLRAAYLEGLQQDRGIKDALANYVSLEGTPLHDSTRFDLENKVQDFLSSDKKILLLLGEAGSGKSTFNRHLAVGLWEAYVQANAVQNSSIPVFIQLSSLPESNRNLVEAFFETQGFTKEQIKTLQSEHRFVLILDGFDEIKDRQRTFYKDNHLDCWKDAKIIISSRPEYLGSNYQYKFHPSGERAALQEYQLAPFSGEAIEKYVDQYKKVHPEGPWSAEQYKEALKQRDLKELVGNPFLLKITLSVLPELSRKLQAKGQCFTRIGLYDEFVNNWFERSQQRLAQIQLNPEETKEFRRLEQTRFVERGMGFSKKLALEMHRAGEVVSTYLATADDPWEEPSAESSQAWRKRLLGNDNAMTVLMRLNAPLICQGDQYRFIHKSLQDYFVARALWEEFSADKEFDLSSMFNRLNIVNDPAVLEFLSERLKQEAELKERLLRVVECSKEEAEFSRGAANALTVLVKAGVQFNGCDLRGIKVPGANLSFGAFDSAQLQGANLRGANLRKSWLRESNLSGAHMDGVQFGEWPHLQEESVVLSCAYSPDGGGFAAGLNNGKIGVYQTSNWEKIWTLIGHTDAVMSLVYSPQGNQLASGSEDETVRLWDIKTGAALHTLSFHAGWGMVLAYNLQGDQLASGGSDDIVRLWDVKTGAELKTLIGHEGAIWSVAYNLKSDQLASGCSDMTVRLWDVKTGAELHILRGHEQMVMSVAYSPQGDQLASCGDDGTVYLWDVKTGAELYTLNGNMDGVDGVHRVGYSPQEDLLLVSGSVDNTVLLWDVKAGVCLNTFSSPMGASLAYSPTGGQLASCGFDNTVRLWDVKMVAELNTFSGHADGIRSVAYSLQGDQLASCSLDNTVRFWDVKTGAELHILRGHERIVMSVAYSPQGDQLVLGYKDGTMCLWDVKTGTELKTFSGHTGSVYSVAYSPQGDQLASCSEDETVRLWDVKMGTELKIFSGHKEDVNGVAYSPQGNQLASCGSDGTVRLWDIKAAAELHILNVSGHTEEEYVFSVAYSPKGDLLASCGGDKTVRLWDTKTGAELYTLIGHTSAVWSVAYSPQGDQLASGGLDSTVRLWEVKTGECQRVIQDCGPVISVAWKEISGGQYLGMGGFDKSVRQWRVKKEGGEYKEIFCWSTGHDFLTVRGALIEGVKGLSEMNERLLRQRGAVGGPLGLSSFFEERSVEKELWA